MADIALKLYHYFTTIKMKKKYIYIYILKVLFMLALETYISGSKSILTAGDTNLICLDYLSRLFNR